MTEALVASLSSRCLAMGLAWEEEEGCSVIGYVRFQCYAALSLLFDELVFDELVFCELAFSELVFDKWLLGEKLTGDQVI